MKRFILIGAAFLAACSTPAPEPAKKAEPEGPPEIKAELVASDPSWGNTEGPALDSKI